MEIKLMGGGPITLAAILISCSFQLFQPTIYYQKPHSYRYYVIGGEQKRVSTLRVAYTVLWHIFKKLRC